MVFGYRTVVTKLDLSALSVKSMGVVLFVPSDGITNDKFHIHFGGSLEY
jgi:hypothetical protein